MWNLTIFEITSTLYLLNFSFRMGFSSLVKNGLTDFSIVSLVSGNYVTLIDLLNVNETLMYTTCQNKDNKI